MNPFELVLAVVAVVMIASVLKSRHKAQGTSDQAGDHRLDAAAADEAAQLRNEVRALRERVQVLERVITDNEASSHRLDREIEALRDLK